MVDPTDSAPGDFFLSYADDLAYLRDARDALHTHPFRLPLWDLIDGSFARQHAIATVGAVELAINHFKQFEPELETYFKARAPNGEKIRSLGGVLVRMHGAGETGTEIDLEVIEDYLAVKYIRNAVEHARYKDYERQHVIARGFPASVLDLRAEHLDKIIAISNAMIRYITAAEQYRNIEANEDEWLARVLHEKEQSLLLVPDSEAGKQLRHPVYRRNQIPILYWRNLESIGSRITSAVEEIAGSRQSTPSHANNYREAWRQSRKHLDLFGATRWLADEALFNLREFRRLALETRGVSVDLVKTAGVELREVFSADGTPLEWGTLGEERLTRALQAANVGRVVHEAISDISAFHLLVYLLPIADPENTSRFLEEAEREIAAWELRELAYAFERRSRCTAAVAVDAARHHIATLREELGSVVT